MVLSNIYLFECLTRLNLLQICMNHILAVLKIPQDRDSGFIALGEMAGALDGELIHYLPTITTHLREAVCFCNSYLKSIFSHNSSYCLLHAYRFCDNDTNLTIHICECRLLRAGLNLLLRP